MGSSTSTEIDEERFIVEPITEENFKEALALNHTVFINQNPVFRHIGVTLDAWKKLEEYDCAGWDKSGCSLLIRDKRYGGDVVAFAFAQVHTFFRPPPSPQLWQEITHICPQLDDFISHVIPVFGSAWHPGNGSGITASLAGRTLRFVAGGTKKGYENMKLQQHLRKRVLDCARERGYDRVVVETINNATEHIWQDKFGFRILASAPFAEYEKENGARPFAGLNVNFSILEGTLRERPIRDSAPIQTLAALSLMALGKLSPNFSQPIYDVSCGACFCNCLPPPPKFKDCHCLAIQLNGLGQQQRSASIEDKDK